MGHAADILTSLQNRELLEQIRREQAGPLPHLGFFHATAAEVDDYINFVAEHCEVMERPTPPTTDRERLLWMNAKHTYPEVKDVNNFPVNCTHLFSTKLSTALGIEVKNSETKNFPLHDALMLDIVMLHELGCRAFFYAHDYLSEHVTHKERQYVVAMPIMLLNGTEEKPEYERDIKGREIFYAWMINRGHATEAQIEAAFGISYLKGAQDPITVRKIEDAFGERIRPQGQQL